MSWFGKHGQEFRIEKLCPGRFCNSKPVWREWGVIVSKDQATAQKHAEQSIKSEVRVVPLAPGEGHKGYL